MVNLLLDMLDTLCDLFNILNTVVNLLLDTLDHTL